MRTKRRGTRPHTLRLVATCTVEGFVGRKLVVELDEMNAEGHLFRWRSTGRRRREPPAILGERFEVVLRRVIREDEPCR